MTAAALTSHDEDERANMRGGQRPFTRDPFANAAERFLAGRIGMWLFLASLAMLFGASLIGFITIRVIIGSDWPHDLPPLPRVLWINTLLLMLSSAALQLGVEAARRSLRIAAAIGVTVALLLGFAFLALQTVAWLQWFDGVERLWATTAEQRLALTAFLVLSGVHALHVIGGVIPMTLVTLRTWRAPGSAAHEQSARSIQLIAMYWHFLGAVWLVLFTALLLAT